MSFPPCLCTKARPGSRFSIPSIRWARAFPHRPAKNIKNKTNAFAKKKTKILLFLLLLSFIYFFCSGIEKPVSPLIECWIGCKWGSRVARESAIFLMDRYTESHWLCRPGICRREGGGAGGGGSERGLKYHSLFLRITSLFLVIIIIARVVSIVIIILLVIQLR